MERIKLASDGSGKLPDPMSGENTFDVGKANVRALSRTWSLTQQIPNESIIRSGTQAEHLWIVAMELLP